MAAQARDPADSESGGHRFATGCLEPDPKPALGAKFRRLRSRLGAPKAITAMAHTLARLVYRMLKFGHHYVDQGIEYYEAKYRQQQLRWTTRQAAALNMRLVPLPDVGS